MLTRTGIRAGIAAAAAVLCAAPALAGPRLTVYPLAGFGHSRHEGTPAANFRFDVPSDIEAAPNGGFTVVDDDRVIHVGSDGIAHFVPGRFRATKLASAADGSVFVADPD